MYFVKRNSAAPTKIEHDFRKLKFLLLGGDDDFTIMKRMIGTGVSLDDLIYLGKFNDPKQGKGKVYYNNTEGDYSLQKDAIDEIIAKYRSGDLKDEEQCYNVKWMKHLNLCL